MKINEKMEKALKNAGISKAEAAKRMGFSRAYLSQLLSPKANPSLKTLEKFFAACGHQFRIHIEKKGETRTEKVPAFENLFWDADRNGLDFNLHRDFLFKRILTLGNVDAVDWMFKTFGAKSIKRFLIESSHQFEEKNLNFWGLIFDVDLSWQNKKQKAQFPSWRKLEK